MTKALLKDIKKGEFFRVSDNENGKVYVKDSYDRSTKKFDVYNWDDVNDFRQMNGTKTVFVGFTF